MADLGSMVVKIVGDVTGFTKSLNETQKKMLAFGINVASITKAIQLVGKAVVKQVQDFSEYGSAIYDASQKTGLSTDAIQEWKFIAEQTGGTLENVTGAVAMMTRGLETNADEFVRLGIETRNADGTFRSTTDIFNDTIATLSSMTDETERDQLAFKLLGRSAQTLIPILNAGASGIADMKREANALGIVIGEDAVNNADALGDSIDALGAASKAYSATIVNNVAPALITVVNGLKDFVQRANDAANVQKNLSDIANGAANIDQMSSALRRLNEQLEGRETLRKNLVGNMSKAAIEAYDKETQSIRDQINATIAAKKEEQRRLELADKTRARLEAERAAAPKDIASVNEKIDATAELNAATEEYNTLKQQEYDLAMWEAAYLAKNAELTRDWSNVITELGNNSRNVTEEMKIATMDWAEFSKEATDIAIQAYGNLFNAIGASLVDGKTGWKEWGNVALDAVAEVVNALGRELVALAAVNLFNPAAAIAYGAAAAAAFVAAGAIKNVELAEGGIAMPRPGGVQATIAEAGMAEAVIPLDRLDRMLETAGGGSDGGMTHLVVNVDSRPILDKVFAATRNRTVLIDSGAVV